MLNNISTIEQKYTPIEKFTFSDITYHRSILSIDGERKLGSTVRIAFNRPDCLNAFRPQTVDELFIALDDARQNPEIGCVILTGNGPSKHGKYSFSSGGDQRIEEKMDTSM